jgi:DNA-binding SARP family transcriptional activator
MLSRMGGELRVQVLGPVLVEVDGQAVPLRRPLERALLVRLALAHGTVVPDERLAVDLWDDADAEDPAARTARLRVVVSRLRRALGSAAGTVTRDGGGYRVVADVPDLRAAREAAHRVPAAVRAGDHPAVRAAAAAALGSWRGTPLSDLPSFSFARGEAQRLSNWWLELTVNRLTAEVALGGGAELVAELTGLAAEHPLHEPLRGLLAVALYRAGRQADSFGELATLRRALADELGVDPTAETADLELRLLRQDPGLRAPAPPTPVPAAPTPAPAPDAAGIRPALARGIVGRRAELAELAGRLDRALAGEVAVVLIEGGPGMGRTRLLEALDHLGQARGLTVCWGRATAAAGVPAFWPWRQALRQWPQRTRPGTAGPVLAGWGGPLTRIVPELAPAGGTDVGAALDPDERFGLFEHVVAFLDQAAAASDGLVLLLDDLHQADLASLLLLAHVARSGSAARLLIAATVQPGQLSADRREAWADLGRQTATSRIALSGLTDSAVAEQLGLVLGQAADPETAAAVARRTGGNPLFVQEIGRMLAAGQEGLPTAIRDAVQHQTSRLPEPGREVLAAAAGLGGEVEADVVAAAAGRPLAEVLGQLDGAAAAGLLARAERPDRFRFANEVVREAAGFDLGSAPRAQLHLRAAEHLEATDTSRVGQIAHHRLEALPLGDQERAVAATSAAGDLALRQFAFEDAAALYAHAIEAGSTLGLATRAGLLLSQAQAQYLSHDVAGAMRTGGDAGALAEHLGDPALLARAATVLPDVGDPGWLATTRRWCRTALAALPDGGDSSLRALLLAQLAAASVWDDDGIGQDSASGPGSTGSVALAMAERLGDPAATYTALRARQLARSGPDGTAERLGLGDRMLGLVPALGGPAELWGRLWRFDALVQLGRVDEAASELDRLEPVVARMRQPLPRWHLIRSRAALLSGRGRFAEARAAADEAEAVLERGGHQAAVYSIHALRLSIAQLTGEPIDPVVFEVERYHQPPRLLSMMAALWYATHRDRDEAERIQAGFPRPEDVPLRPFMHVMFHAVSGQLAAALDDEAAADHAYRELRPYADLHVAAGAGIGFTGGSVHGVLGTIAAARGRTGPAAGHLRAAVAANTRAGLVPYAALARQRLEALGAGP